VLTHGHFDHVGSVIELADYWNVPVYAHKLELPYLVGQMDYPPARSYSRRRFNRRNVLYLPKRGYQS
jgi:glyoxylase-like metal-dependent hydrolase (beta-lactamase superfamily II)